MRTSNKAVRTFFRWRGYIIATVLVAFIIYSSYPTLNFGWVLIATAASFVALAVIITWFKRSRLPANRK